MVIWALTRRLNQGNGFWHPYLLFIPPLLFHVDGIIDSRDGTCGGAVGGLLERKKMNRLVR